jgi:hypothetical protein
MAMRIIGFVGVVLLALGAASCQKLGTDQARAGGLAFQQSGFSDAIPAEFGKLVAVTSNDARPDIAQLWFEKPDGTTVMVAVNYIDGKLAAKALTIPRR